MRRPGPAIHARRRRTAGQLVPSAVACQRRQRRHVHRSRVERIVGRLRRIPRRTLRRRPTRSSIRSRRPIRLPTRFPTPRPSPCPDPTPDPVPDPTPEPDPVPDPAPDPVPDPRPSRSRFPTRSRNRPNRPRRHEPAALVDGRAESGHGRLGRRRRARAADARRPSPGARRGHRARRRRASPRCSTSSRWHCAPRGWTSSAVSTNTAVRTSTPSASRS